MKTKNKLHLYGLSLPTADVGLAMFLLPATTHAGGLFLNEFSAADLGLAGSGWARGQDAGTLYRNPAGMSLLDGNQYQSTTGVLYGDVHFTNNGRSSPSLGTGDGGSPINWVPGGASGFYTYQINKDFSVGFGLCSDLGLALKYDPGWIGRYYIKQGVLQGVSLVPGASYRINDKISVGAGLMVRVAKLKYETAINNGSPALRDGSMKLQDWEAGFGGIFGVMLEPWKGTRFGVTYYSPVELDFADTPDYNDVGPVVNRALNAAGLIGNKINLGLTVPQRVKVGVYQQLTDRLAVMADFGWDNWSEFGKVDVSIDDTQTSATTAIPYQDTYDIGIAAQYQLTPQWRIDAGFTYNSEMVRDQDRTVTLPQTDIFKFGVGAEYQATKTWTVGMGYELYFEGDFSAHQTAALPGSAFSRGNVSGDFKNTALHWFALNVRYTF
jgi:long-chain fatty acid transport protein